jgi:hypothetical protein
MPTVTLLTKAHNNFQLRQVNEFLKSRLQGLKVEAEFCGRTSRGWVQMVVSGEDENVALHYLVDEIGLCPTRLEKLEKLSVVKGQIMALDKNKSELRVDIGVSLPKVVDATIPLQHLQAQLTDGRKVALEKIAELFGFCEKLPLSIKISSINGENLRIEAMLSEKQLTQYGNWKKSLLDRLIILGASLRETELAIKRAMFRRDVVTIEPLGLFEHTVVCKLGTDAAGLIPKIGNNLRNASFSIFNPRRVLGFLGNDSLS